METRLVTAGPDLESIRALFREYAEGLGVDLSFQGFAEELAALPGEYAPPRGMLMLGLVEGRPGGCVAVHPWKDDACEMKRLFVRPAFQGRGYGECLVRRAIDWAKDAGYERMLLDTLPAMAAAQGLYRRLGFVEVEPYRFNPIEGSRFMELRLGDH